MSRPVLIAIIGFVAAIAALGLAMSLDSGENFRRADLPSSASEPAVPPVPVQTAPSLPAFDVVRISEKGDAVLAGRAQPKAAVVVLDGEHELGRVQADERGEWVFVPPLPLAPGVRALMVEAHAMDGGTSRSADPVIVVVPENAADPALAVVPLPEGGARLIMAPNGEPEPVTVDLVDRDGSGRLFMGGRARSGALIHIYMDNGFLGRVQADDEGGWRLAVKAAQGHMLRADLVDGNGKVLARLELPLEPEPVHSAEATTGAEKVVVEQGGALWKIGRRLYGAAPSSTVIYQTSKDRMRDPDHIYPGQVFQVPKK